MKKKNFILVGVLLAVALGIAAVSWLRLQNKGTGPLTLYGNVEIRDALLAFNEQEIITEILAEEGDFVRAGQILARLRTKSLAEQLAEARSQLEAQAQVVRRLEDGSRPQEVKQARAEVSAAEVRVRNARLSLERLELTSVVGASSKQALDDAQALLEEEQAQLKVKQQNLALVLEGPRKEEVEQAKAQLDANRYRVAYFEERIAETVLKAPSDGVIQSRILEPGEAAGPSRPVFILALTDPKWIRAYVPEKSLGLIRQGMTAKVYSDTWPGKSFAGQVGFISSVAEFTPQNVETPDLRTNLVYEVRVIVQDPENRLRLGMPVTVTIEDGHGK